MAFSSQKYSEVIKLLATHDTFCHTLNEPLPNGLTPLDIAEKLGLDEAVTVISSAGGQHGIWASMPVEIMSRHGPTLLQIRHQLMNLLSLGSQGEHAVQAMFSHLPTQITTVEQGTSTVESHLYQYMMLNQRPDLSIVATSVIDLVNADWWYRLGVSLKISQVALFNISSTHSSPKDSYLKVLCYWLDQNKTASWRTLLEILGHFETKQTVDRLTQEIMDAQVSEMS